MKRILLLCLCCWLHGANAADTVQRCEGKDGKVTYSNTQCPAGTQPVRKVNTDPPISVEEQKAAKERARRDADEVKQIEKQRKADDAKATRSAGEKAKSDAKASEACDKARKAQDKARDERAGLSATVATIAQIQKADAELKRRTEDTSKACGR